MMSHAHVGVAPFGFTALGLGALSLLGAMVVIYAGPFSPQPSIGTALGEFTADYINSALRGLKGVAQPEAVARTFDIDRFLAIGVSAFGVLSVVLGLIGLARKEPAQIVICGLSVGIAALTFQFVAWLALLICGIILLVSIIGNIGSIFDVFSG